MDSSNGRRPPQPPRRVDTSAARGRKAQAGPIEPFPVAPRRAARTPEPPAPTRPESTHKKKKRRGRPTGTQSQGAARRRVSRGELRRRRRRRRLLAVFLVLALVGVGLTLSVTVLFKVKEFRVENMDKTTPANTGIYTEDAILGALAVPLEENMFQFSVKEREQAMAANLPYLETVRVRRSLPGTVVVQVEPATETWCAQVDSGWLVLSRKLKIMKVQPEQPEGLPVLLGLEAQAPRAGDPLSLAGPLQAADPAPSGASAAPAPSSSTGAEQLKQLNALLDGLEAEGLGRECTVIDLSEENEAYFVYQGRVKVLLGTFNNLDYKLSAAGLLLRNESGEYLSASDRGTLDVSHQMEGSVMRMPFSPGDFSVGADEPEQPAQGDAPEEGEDPPPEGGEPDGGTEPQE